MTKLKTKKQNNSMKPVKSSLKKQKKLSQPKTPRLILPKKLNLQLIPFEEWDSYAQYDIVDHGYNFVARTLTLEYYEDIKTEVRNIYTKKQGCYGYFDVPLYMATSVYKEKEIDTILQCQGCQRELDYFKKLFKEVAEISSVDISYCYLFHNETLGIRIPTYIPKEDVGFIKTVIELYNDNYNDRITNLKAAFEQRKLQQVQPDSVSGKVPKTHKGNKSKTIPSARKSKKSTRKSEFTPIATATAK